MHRGKVSYECPFSRLFKPIKYTVAVTGLSKIQRLLTSYWQDIYAQFNLGGYLILRLDRRLDGRSTFQAEQKFFNF
jgi:hypothetical protein